MDSMNDNPFLDGADSGRHERHEASSSHDASVRPDVPTSSAHDIPVSPSHDDSDDMEALHGRHVGSPEREGEPMDTRPLEPLLTFDGPSVPRSSYARNRRSITIVFIVLALAFGGLSGYAATSTWYAMNPTVKTVTRTVKQSFPSDDDNMRILASELRNQDASLDDMTIAAIAGNAWGESKADPATLEQSASTPSSTATDDEIRAWAQSGHGIGIMQWTGERAVNLMKYAADRHVSWRTIPVQVGFLIAELNDVNNWRTPVDNDGRVDANGATGRSDFMNAADVRTANNAFLLGFVRPAKPGKSRSDRLSASLSMYSYIQTHNE